MFEKDLESLVVKNYRNIIQDLEDFILVRFRSPPSTIVNNTF